MSARRPPTWPVIPLALPAAVSIWGGWVGLGQLTGFGVVQLLPGIWDGLRINTAVTLPIGMEAYAAYALHVWLHRGSPRRARDFARVSSIVALALGALGQVAYHLMAAAGVQSAPWPITAAVACLPVGVLGMGATLAHLLSSEPDGQASASTPAADSRPPADEPTGGTTPAVPVGPPVRATAPARPEPVPPVRPEFAPAVPPGHAPERLAGSTRTALGGRSADRSARAGADRSGTATRTGSTRKRTGGPRTDAQLAAEVRELAEQDGTPPSAYQLKQRFGIGSSRAARLLAELGDLTLAGAPGHNGTARKEGTQ